MAPKRKASERDQTGAGNPLTEHDPKAETVTASGTLAGASGQSVDTLLGRVGNRRLRAFAAKGTKAKSSGALPLPKPRAVAEAVCGAPAQAQAAAAEQKAAYQNDEENADLASASDWEWEDAAEEEEDWETAEADDMPTAVSGVAGSFDLETTEEAGPSRPRRKGITKEDREMARLLHRTHLLCLLSRGLLYDEAANDPLLQATMLSLVPPEIVPPSDTRKGVSPPALQPLLSWFQHTFQQLPPALPQSPEEDDFAGKADGVDSVTEQLQAVAMAKQGTAEQLQALFVSLCRAQALLVRSVRVLDPMPLNPGVRRAASAHLKQPRRQKPKPDPAATANSATASAAATTQGASVTADPPSKKGRGRKRKSVESAEIDEVLTSPDASHKTSSAKTAKATQKRGKKAADQLTDGVLDDGKGSTRTQVQHRHPAAKGKRRGSKGAAEEPDEAQLQLQDDMAAACAASLVDSHQSDAGAQLAAKAKRVGDIELENQLAMAMASTAAEAKHRAQRKPTAKAVHDEPMPSPFSPRSGVPKPTLGETWARDARLANQDLAQSSAASCWAEVFCGSAELGKWVHVDPLLNWLDVPDKVEGAGIRPGGLAYVVAFANRGAKDVTQRYTGSVLAADKLRDNAWWEQTLNPLRKHEVAATTLHHKAQQLPAALQDANEHQPGQASGSDLKSPQGRSPAALPPPAAVSEATRYADDKTSKLAARAAELALKREDAELSQRAAAERRGLPSNVEGFKQHPGYVLERHIGRYFALKPGTKKAGMHRGEGFYPREALAELHTADRWLRDGLEVKSEELANPYKVVKRRGVKDPPGLHTDPSKGPSEEEDVQATSVIPVPDSMVTKMYGRWQTQQWEVPTAVGGVVPKNDRGNVHCPPLASELPKGTVHLQMPRLGPICKKLSVDYAPAMTGFDIRGGRSVPVIEGVVVCKEDEATVLEAYIEDERLREERAAERRKQEAHAAWRQLLRSIWTRLRLHQDYGDNAAAHAGQHHADHGILREDLSGASEIVDLIEDQPGEAAGPSQQPKGQLKQPQSASAASDAPHDDSQSHNDDGIHQAGQLNGRAKLPSNKRGKSTGTDQAQPAAARRQASRQPNGKAQAGDAPAAKYNTESDHDVGHGNDGYEPTENKVERRSKSGLVVEMEEI